MDKDFEPVSLLRRIGHVLGVLGVILIFALWLFAAVIDISLGCPPPPFAHRCLMKQAGVLPPYYATEESEGGGRSLGGGPGAGARRGRPPDVTTEHIALVRAAAAPALKKAE